MQRIRNTDKTLENITGKYLKELEGIRQLKKQIIDDAKKEAEEIVRGANKQVENTIRTIKESQADKTTTNEARKELQNFMNALSEKKKQEEASHDEYIEKPQDKKLKKEE